MDGVAVDPLLGADVVGLDPGFDDVLWVGHDPGADAAQAASCEDPGGVRLVAPGEKKPSMTTRSELFMALKRLHSGIPQFFQMYDFEIVECGFKNWAERRKLLTG